MVFVLEKKKTTKPYDTDYYKVLDKRISVDTLRGYFSLNKKSDKILHFKAEVDPIAFEKPITFTNTCTSKVIKKISSRANFHLKEEDIGNGIDVLQDFLTQKHVDILKDTQFEKGDGVFVLRNDEVKNANFNKTEKKKIKPYYTSEELEKYYGDSKNKYFIIYADLDVRSNIDVYPHIKRHLDQFKKILTSDFKPYGLHRPREQKFFEDEKILSLRKTKEVSFTYTDFPCYVSRAFLIVKPNNIDLKYLTGLLNSRLVNFWLYHMGKRQGEQLQVDKNPLMELPIYRPNNQNENIKQEEIIRAVDGILEIKKNLKFVKLVNEQNSLERQVSSLEKRIDALVYSLYGITEEERAIIEMS